jgi:hypothetical protein
MKIFARGMKWTGLLIMGVLVVLGAKNSTKINEWLDKLIPSK